MVTTYINLWFLKKFVFFQVRLTGTSQIFSIIFALLLSFVIPVQNFTVITGIVQLFHIWQLWTNISLPNKNFAGLTVEVRCGVLLPNQARISAFLFASRVVRPSFSSFQQSLILSFQCSTDLWPQWGWRSAFNFAVLELGFKFLWHKLWTVVCFYWQR